MCYAYAASSVDTLPCIVPLPSIARADVAFAQQAYWSGRAWGPPTALVYFGLLRYDHVQVLRQARYDLVALGMQVMLAEWRVYGRIGENYNAYIGVTQDSGNADAFYAWGGLFGLPALLEAGY